MLKAFRQSLKTMIQPYPEEYKERIETLRQLGEKEIQACIHDILSKPQRFVQHSEKMMLSEAILEAQDEEVNMLEFEAPLLTFPRATPTCWNGNIDHIDTLTGTYNIFTGKEYEIHNLRLNKKYSGGPKFITALQKALGSQINVTMRVDCNSSPSSRIILVF